MCVWEHPQKAAQNYHWEKTAPLEEKRWRTWVISGAEGRLKGLGKGLGWGGNAKERWLVSEEGLQKAQRRELCCSTPSGHDPCCSYMQLEKASTKETRGWQRKYALRRYVLLEVLIWDRLETQVSEGSSSRSLSATWKYNIHCWESKK